MKNAIDAEIQTRRRNGAWQTEITQAESGEGEERERGERSKAERKKSRVTKSVGSEQIVFRILQCRIYIICDTFETAHLWNQHTHTTFTPSPRTTLQQPTHLNLRRLRLCSALFFLLLCDRSFGFIRSYYLFSGTTNL